MTMQWLTIAVISASAAIILYGFKMMVARFDRLIQEVQGLKEVTVGQDAKIGENKRHIEGHKERLDNHAERIRKVELVQAKNGN